MALKHAVKEPINSSLGDIYYLYANSSKKQRELKNLFNVLEGQFEKYSAGVRSVKATGTRWTDHKIRAMDRVVEKFGLYNQYLQNVISNTANAKARATIEGKYAKLVDAKVLLRCVLFIDVLAEAENFSLKTQNIDINIIDIIEAAENTKQDYQRLLKHLEKDLASILKLSTLELITDDAEANEDGEPHYQDEKLKHF